MSKKQNLTNEWNTEQYKTNCTTELSEEQLETVSGGRRIISTGKNAIWTTAALIGIGVSPLFRWR